jgi:hypothetical protein
MAEPILEPVRRRGGIAASPPPQPPRSLLEEFYRNTLEFAFSKSVFGWHPRGKRGARAGAHRSGMRPTMAISEAESGEMTHHLRPWRSQTCTLVPVSALTEPSGRAAVNRRGIEPRTESMTLPMRQWLVSWRAEETARRAPPQEKN